MFGRGDSVHVRPRIDVVRNTSFSKTISFRYEATSAGGSCARIARWRTRIWDSGPEAAGIGMVGKDCVLTNDLRRVE